MQDPNQYQDTREVLGWGPLLEDILIKLIETMQWNKASCSNDQINILDYGCGPGKTGFNYILPKVVDCEGNFYSVDISQEMINFATKNFGHEKIKYSVGNILEGFSFQNVQFDKIFAIHVFHFFPDLKPALKEFSKILKPKGQICFTCSPFSDDVFYKSVLTLAKKEEWKEYFTDCKKTMPLWTKCEKGQLESHVKQYFVDAGFTCVKLNVWSFPMNVPTEPLIEFITSVTPCMSKIPSELQAKLREDMRSSLTDVLGLARDSDRISFDYGYISGIVQKE